MIWGFLSAALGLGKEAVEARGKLKVAEHGATWEILALQETRFSLKDERFTGALSVPLILSFWPGAAAHVCAGFEALSQAPDWYFVFLGGAVSLAFGIRLLPKIGRPEKKQ